MATSTAAPLPDLPDNPVGDLPANPLGVPPAPPVVGKRQPLRFPDLRNRNGGGGRSTRAPLPNLDLLNQRRRAIRQANKAQKAPTPAAPAARPAAQAQPTAPIVLRPQVAPAAPASERGSEPGRRRTPAEVRETDHGHYRALFGSQIADHPLMQRAEYRQHFQKYLNAKARKHQAKALTGGLEKAEKLKKKAQATAPGYTPPESREPPLEGPGLSPEQKAEMRRRRQATRDALEGRGVNPMAGPMRNVGAKPPEEGQS